MQIQLYAYKKLTLNMKTQKIGKYMHDEHYLRDILSNYIIICQFFERKQSQTFIYLRTELQNAYHENYFLRISRGDIIHTIMRFQRTSIIDETSRQVVTSRIVNIINIYGTPSPMYAWNN